MAARPPHAQPQPSEREALEHLPEREAGHGPRYHVRIERHAPRPLDEDNLKGGCKALVDCLREAGIIPDDAPDVCRIEAVNVRSTRATQGTRIIVTETLMTEEGQ